MAKRKGICDRFCKGCVYNGYFAGGELSICEYFLITNQLRPCPAGTGCTVKKTGKKISRWDYERELTWQKREKRKCEPKEREVFHRVCACCGTAFDTVFKQQIYCCKKCKMRMAQRAWIKRNKEKMEALNMAKKRHKGIMGRSDIPLAQRLQMQRRAEIVNNRNHAAKIAMFCNAVALHDVEGIGYKRLVRYSQHFKEVVDEFYEDPIVGMAHAKRRMEQMGRPISGELFTLDQEGRSKRDHEIDTNMLQAAQIAFICGEIAMNDFFGLGQQRLKIVSDRTGELTARYAKEGEGFLLDEMKKIGFLVSDGEVIAFVDDDEQPVTPKQAKKDGFSFYAEKSTGKTKVGGSNGKDENC